MPKSPSDVDNLVAFLSGFNLLFLTYLTILMAISFVLEGGGVRGDFYPIVDFHLDLETALSKSCGHSLGLAGYMMGAVGVVVVIFRVVGKNGGLNHL